MASSNPNGRNVAPPDDENPGWRPEDDDREENWRGAGQSGYSAGFGRPGGAWQDRSTRETGYRGPVQSSEQHMGYRGESPRQADDRFARPGGHRGKGPAGYTRSDDRIRESACEALTDDDHVDATDIEVVVHDGEVTLTGSVDDRETKRRAEDCVLQVTGVRDVQNQLRLRARGQGNRSSAGEVSTDKKHRA
jgi:hypothetical protein